MTAGRNESFRRYLLIVLFFAAAVYAGCMISPPHLMDDVDAVQAQIARNMLSSGDWVTARLDGVAYLEKAPLIYWLIAICFKLFGAYDWVARIPVVLACLGLAWVTAEFGNWAFGKRAGFYAGLCMATCVGLFLFTRILIPDVMLTLDIALAMWAFLRTIDPDEAHTRRWSIVLAACMGTGLLLKSLIGVLFPLAAGLLYLGLTRQLFDRAVWRRIHPLSGCCIAMAIALPWHVLATLRNPPYFDFTMRSIAGQYHGFFWFFFINEQLLRFLNLRYPRDYNTVPRVLFWGFHLLWLFPWSVYLPVVFEQRFSLKPVDRAARTRLLALCWIGFVMVFFTFSTTQEYYSMPIYPALALLLGAGIAAEGVFVRPCTRLLGVVLGVAGMILVALWWLSRDYGTPGDIAGALSRNPMDYTLSLGHVEDLNMPSFAYLRTPLVLATLACAIGAAGALFLKGRRAILPAAVWAVVFFQAARLAMVVFDPYMSSEALAEALNRAPEGKLIVDHHYYDYSSVFFYTNRTALLLNGRFNNLVYGSYAPGAPDVFIDDNQWQKLWLSPERYYLVANAAARERLGKLVGPERLYEVARSGGKFLLTNR